METKRQTQVGTIIKKSSANTLKVRVERKRPHPLYGKVVTTHKNYLVDCTDEQFDNAVVGTVVEIISSRPISKLKSWKFNQVVTKE